MLRRKLSFLHIASVSAAGNCHFCFTGNYKGKSREKHVVKFIDQCDQLIDGHMILGRPVSASHLRFSLRFHICGDGVMGDDNAFVSRRNLWFMIHGRIWNLEIWKIYLVVIQLLCCSRWLSRRLSLLMCSQTKSCHRIQRQDDGSSCSTSFPQVLVALCLHIESAVLFPADLCRGNFVFWESPRPSDTCPPPL